MGVQDFKSKSCFNESDPYRQQGTVVSTTSNDFPHIICNGSKLYLFPASLYFVETERLTKSMKTRMAEQMLNGTSIEFESDCQNIVVKYERDQKNRRNTLPEAGPDLHIIRTGVFSSEMPRRCWSDHAGLLNVSTDLMNLPPNVAYKITIRCSASLKDPEDESYLPIPQMKFELGNILEPVNDEIAVSEAVWNLKDYVFYDMSSESPHYNEGPQPQKVVENKVVYVVDGNQLVWPDLPKYKVVMGVVNQKKALLEGVAIKADMFFSSRNQFYVVCRYSLYKKVQPVQTKQVVEDCDSHIEYRVNLKRSSRRGFFVCTQFNFCLVEDVHKVLTTAASNPARTCFPAWIRLNNRSMVASFSVTTAVNEHYSINELWSGIPKQYPLIRFVLFSSDKFCMQVGDWIHIEAVYFSDKDIYLVLRLSPIKSKIPVIAFSSVDGYLFEDTLSCSNVKVAARVYDGSFFGLVTDTEDLVMDKIKKTHKNVWPNGIRVLLRENADRSNSVAFNIVYTYPFNIKELEANESYSQDPSRRWWKRRNNETSCLCREAQEIAKDILGVFVGRNQVPKSDSLDELKKLVM